MELSRAYCKVENNKIVCYEGTRQIGKFDSIETCNVGISKISYLKELEKLGKKVTNLLAYKFVKNDFDRRYKCVPNVGGFISCEMIEPIKGVGGKGELLIFEDDKVLIKNRRPNVCV